MLGEARGLCRRDALLLIIGYRSVAGVERLLQVKIVCHAGGKCQKARPARFALAQRTHCCYLPHTPMSTKPEVISKAPVRRTITPCSL